jgi:predicted MFS family arabinose efflux permease
VAFSLSAVIWVLTAPHWAKRADRRGRRALMRLGLYGFIASMLVCGTVLAIGLSGRIAPMTVFIVFVLGRAIYGGWGSASPPAVQAYVAARTEGDQRTNALAAIASSFGLGTIIGPAIAPLFIFPPLGLSGPLIIFAAIGALVLTAIVLRIPDDTPRSSPRGQIVAYPSIGGIDGSGPTESASEERPDLRWRDPRVVPWHVIGIVGGHGQAAMLGVIGFLVIDRLAVPLAEAQQWIAIVLMAGAGASLLAQWGLIPRLGLNPRQLVYWGALLSAVGAVVVALADGAYGTTIGFALASLGFGFFRPGFTSGASLAVRPGEQNIVAGMVTSVNGVAYIAGPAAGVALYQIARPLPWFAIGALMLSLALGVWWKLRAQTPT